MGLRIQSPAEQVAAHLREEIAGGRWKDEMPGISHLQKVLGVNHVTINGALKLLEREGLLVSQGRRRCRRIADSPGTRKGRKLRVRLLHYDKQSRTEPDYLSILDKLHQQGYTAGFARKSLHELGMDDKRVARFVRGVEADAWIVSGASREIFQWFSDQDILAIALFGSFSRASIAGVGVRKSPLMSRLVRQLVDLGHERIVLLSHRERVVPELGLYQRNFLQVLADCGIATSSYNVPEWEPTQAGLLRRLDTLFRHTPPTAVLVDEPRHFIAVQNYLASRGVRSPDEVSLICSDPDPSFEWCEPTVTHMRWDLDKVVNHVVRWANRVAVGKVDRRQKLYDAELVEGGTVGPVPR